MGNMMEEFQSSLRTAWQRGEDQCDALDQWIKNMNVKQRLALMGLYGAIATTALAVTAVLETPKDQKDDVRSKQSAPLDPVNNQEYSQVLE
ncbi:hypothetical protein COU18_00035 [Candidatus Kaiserbacteria bacterium CG10_big_fil_rev_8_21_14_0_10_51_14]|uniref:Uncharacterized protein n=1 Tax=Candidatus Kaiserbacteria bacterium CG10_big_fil_rev_8_21_14_0_10_51_14 TaxID=1974610 RepID=A0A2H0UCU7_9BACT|nr:MAG: hypothetical protein COU18_00035 [Candidatus Kaiserbacteria bacterium CG10_big_fil_rev_8_21_14_0_10_51_14]